LLEPLEESAQVVGLGGVEPGLGPAAAVVVLTDEDSVGEDHFGLTGWRMHLEGDVREEVALVVSIEVDLEDASHVGLVVGMVIEGDAVDLDRPVVPRGIRCRRRTCAPEYDRKQDPR
jgi:hypothetical protein